MAFAVEWYDDYYVTVTTMANYVNLLGYNELEMVYSAWQNSTTPDPQDYWYGIWLTGLGVRNRLNGLAENAITVPIYCGSETEHSAWEAVSGATMTGFSCNSCLAIEEFWYRMTCGRYPYIEGIDVQSAVYGNPSSPADCARSLAECVQTGTYFAHGNAEIVVTDGKSCKGSDVVFLQTGAFDDTAYCSTIAERGVAKLLLRGFGSAANYPSNAETLATLPARGGPGIVARYKAHVSGAHETYDWVEQFASGGGEWSHPFTVDVQPNNWAEYSTDSTEIESAANGDSVGLADAEVPNPPESVTESACADIVIYSSRDDLAEIARVQIAADAPNLRVKKIVPTWALIFLAGGGSYYGPDYQAQTCKNWIAQVRAANAAWNATCGGGGAPCRQYPVTPGPEVYIVGDTSIVHTAKYTPTVAACLGSMCRSDLAIYDLLGTGLPEGPLSRIPAWTTTQVSRACSFAHDYSAGIDIDPSKRVLLLAGDQLQNGTDLAAPITTLQNVSAQYSAFGYAPRPIIRESAYSTCDGARPTFRAALNQGAREIFGYGMYTGRNTWPGYMLDCNTAVLTKRQRVVVWLPDCEIHNIWLPPSNFPTSGICEFINDCMVVQQLMFNDPAKTCLAASVGHMDRGYDGSHREVAKYLSAERRAAGQLSFGVRRSVARVAYEAVRKVGIEKPWLKDHALALSVFGSRVMLPNGGGGGGGACPVVDAYIAGEWSEENTILGRSADGALLQDGLRLGTGLGAVDDRYRVRIRENEQERTTLDYVALAIVDRDPSVRTCRTELGYKAGQRVHAAQVRRGTGEDVTGLITGNGDGLVLEPGDELYVEQSVGSPKVGETRTLLGYDFDLEGSEKDPPPDLAGHGSTIRPDALTDQRVLSETGLLLQRETTDGVWETVRHYYPRAQFEESITEGLGSNRVRIVAVGKHRIRFVGRFIPSGIVSPVVLSPIAAYHTRLGNVRGATGSIGAAVTYIQPGDTLKLEFAVPSLPAGKVRDAFVVTRGVYTAVPTSPSASDGVNVFGKFELGPARPNPSTGETTIGFTLARESEIRLGIYNVAGRLVRTLEKGVLPPGPHEAVWDGRDSGGRVVSAGMYFYRLVTEGWSSKQKLIMLQR